MRRLRLMLGPRWRIPLAVLNVLPIAGVGAIVVGRRNAHTRLLRNGVLQAALVVLGSWPLVLPGAIGLAWAATDAVRIAQAELLPVPPPPATEPA